MIHKFEHRYNISDEVYHITPDSKQGVIIDIRYSVRYKEVKYEVVFGPFISDDVWCCGDELTDQKIF